MTANPIRYGVTHCPWCELPYALDGIEIGLARYCYRDAPLASQPCSDYASDAQTDRLIAVLQERDALRAELALVHAGQLSLMALVAAEGDA